MKQSTLSFTAAKRTASNVNVAKRKVSASSAAEKAKAAKSSKKPLSKKRDVSDEESNNDDAVSKESNEEGVSQTSNSEEKQIKLSIPEDGGTHDPPQTRSVTEKAVPSTTMKRGSAKVQDLETRRSLPFRESNLTPEVLQNKINANDIDQLPELDPSNKKWNKQYAAARAKQGGQTTMHGRPSNKIHEILRVFDNSSEYGPCVGMTRLERWERAESLGLNPPKEIYEILMTKQGQTSDEYKESVFYGEV